MLVPVFTLKFNHKINPRTVTIGKYDGKRSCLTGATTGGKIFIHNPTGDAVGGGVATPRGGGMFGGRVTQGDMSMLNVNQVISSVVAGRLNPESIGDVLVVGTQTNVLAYDVINNKDLFYKEVSDGANAIAIGRLSSIEAPLAVVGGNCSIQGFDCEGNDLFWTVTGDNVHSLALLDYDNDGKPEMVVGSEDFDIRVFRDDEIIAEITETEIITNLCSMGGNMFGYALGNGTIGVYEKSNRNWRIKSRNIATSILGFDLNGDGVDELITGWSNGKIDVRSSNTGEIIFKDQFSNPIAGVVQGDYRGDGGVQLICCSVEGEVRGYPGVMGQGGGYTGQPGGVLGQTSGADLGTAVLTGAAAAAVGTAAMSTAVIAGSAVQQNLMDTDVEMDSIRDLSLKKQNLLLELSNYEENRRAAEVKKQQQHVVDPDSLPVGIIPANTQVQSSINLFMGNETNPRPGIEVFIATTNDTLVRCVIVFAEGIFDGESHCIHPPIDKTSNEARVAIYPPKDIPVDLYLKIFVGYKDSIQFHVFEMMRTLPKFSMYHLLHDRSAPAPLGHVTFTLGERINRMVLWINQNFLLTEELRSDGTSLNVRFVCLRDMKLLDIHMKPSGQMEIRTDDMDLAGQIIQEMGSFLNIVDLSSTASFPEEFEKISKVFTQVQDFQTTRQKLSAEVADNSNLIRTLVVRAEDARIMGDMKSMRKGYQELLSANRDLLNGYRIRSNNHQQLLTCLKQLNQFIQRASQLRLGTYKTEVVNGCREAIKTTNINLLLKIIETGST